MTIQYSGLFYLILTCCIPASFMVVIIRDPLPKDCGDPPTPSHGTVELTSGNTTVGSTAIQVCIPGYHLIGTVNISCTEDGSWSAPPVDCSLIDCGHPPAPAYGRVTLDDGITTYGANATHTCNPGYDLIGAAAIWCGVDGSWSAPSVTCSLKDCGDPPTPAHGKVTLTRPGKTTVGSTATRVCNPGYELVGTANISCRVDGLWSASPVICFLRVHGAVLMTIPGKTKYGSTATQVCNTGYDLIGTANISCRADGFWSSPPVICSLIDCGLPANPGNGSIALDSGVTTYGSTATRKCNPGYVSIGLATIQCKADGTWADRHFTCALADCGAPTIPNNGAVILTHHGMTTYGSSAAQFCDIGHDLAGSVNISCGIDGSWSHPPVSCTLIDCDNPPVLSNGIVTLTTKGVTTYYATAKISCNKGYTLRGNDTMICNDGGMWIQNAECIINDCKTPEQPVNGNVKLKVNGFTTYGATANVTCNTGYDLFGDGLIWCKEGGLWSSLPLCKPKDCNDPPAPSNGTVNLTTTGVTTYKATAKLNCNKGYSLNGNDTMVCNANGTWSQNADCIINDCKPPEQPTNGVVELTVDLLTTYGATAVVTCNTGYELRGDGSLLCKADGVWSTLPSCYIKDCNYPPAPSNGTVNLTATGVTTYKATAKLYCNKGYSLNGNGTMKCKADGMWSQNAECSINDCKTPEQPANGVVELSVDLLTTYGASALVTCNTGYELKGDGLLLCKADGLWSTLPSCNIKAYIPAVAASCGAVGLGIASVAGYWFGCRRWMKALNSVSASNSSDSNKENKPDHEQSTDGITPDVEW